MPPRVTPQAPRTGPINPDDLYDLQLGPGDPYVRAAFNRISRQNPGGTAALRDTDGTDSLMIAKTAKRSRAMNFTVQGIVWKAGFAKELEQTPLGQASRWKVLPPQAVSEPGGAILRHVDASVEQVFRELIPPALLDAGDRMYGIVRKLIQISIFYFPRDEGATAGVIAHYGDGPAARRHYLYLQTNIKKADPAVLDQILQTFQMAVPKAEAQGQQPKPVDFWQEFERSMYQIRATYQTSALHQNSAKAKAQATRSLKVAGDRLESALSVFDRIEQGILWLAALPARGLIGFTRGLTRAMVRIIQASDRMFRR
jgi:hypothetical protein